MVSSIYIYENQLLNIIKYNISIDGYTKTCNYELVGINTWMLIFTYDGRSICAKLDVLTKCIHLLTYALAVWLGIVSFRSNQWTSAQSLVFKVCQSERSIELFNYDCNFDVNTIKSIGTMHLHKLHYWPVTKRCTFIPATCNERVNESIVFSPSIESITYAKAWPSMVTSQKITQKMHEIDGKIVLVKKMCRFFS